MKILLLTFFSLILLFACQKANRTKHNDLLESALSQSDSQDGLSKSHRLESDEASLENENANSVDKTALDSFETAKNSTYRKTAEPIEPDAIESENSKNSTPTNIPKQKTKNGKKIVLNDSVYQVVFYNENGEVSGSYDIWKNNPFQDIPFKQLPHLKLNGPKRHILPNIEPENVVKLFKGYTLPWSYEVPVIGRIDVYTHLPSIYDLDKIPSLFPVVYQACFMEGFEEEYGLPGAIAIINLVDTTGRIVHSFELNKYAGQSIGVDPKERYIAYASYETTKGVSGSITVQELKTRDIVFYKRFTDGRRVSGAFYHKDDILGFGIHDPLKKLNSTHFYISPINEKVYSFDVTSSFRGGGVFEKGIISNDGISKLSLIPNISFDSIILEL